MDDLILYMLSTEPNSETLPYCSPFQAKGDGKPESECLLCKDPDKSAEAVWISVDLMKEHCRDARHMAHIHRAKVLQRTVCEKLRHAQRLSQKMDRVGAPDSLRVDLARYLFNPTLPGPPDRTLVRKLSAQLDKFARNEPTTLLELAVWKAACLINIQPLNKDVFELREWKALKAECRRHPLIEVVLSHVVPFL